MLQSLTDFPHAGSLCFRLDTAEPARIIRHNPDGTTLIERRERLLDGSTRAIPGASGNVTVPLAELFAEPEQACRPQRRARRSRRANA
jgi:hypothetical protein